MLWQSKRISMRSMFSSPFSFSVYIYSFLITESTHSQMPLLWLKNVQFSECVAVCLLWSAVSSLATAFCARFCGQNTWLPMPCRHVNRAASDASVSLSPASSPSHVSSFLLHALRLRGRTCIRMRSPVTGAARPDEGRM